MGWLGWAGEGWDGMGAAPLSHFFPLTPSRPHLDELGAVGRRGNAERHTPQERLGQRIRASHVHSPDQGLGGGRGRGEHGDLEACGLVFFFFFFLVVEQRKKNERPLTPSKTALGMSHAPFRFCMSTFLNSFSGNRPRRCGLFQGDVEHRLLLIGSKAGECFFSVSRQRPHPHPSSLGLTTRRRHRIWVWWRERECWTM